MYGWLFSFIFYGFVKIILKKTQTIVFNKYK